ncbi:hypothetical protein [Streptomyces sp. NPDC048350]|uniref:hypothetical protein n=1 Tax=Streptomyces sp. NPDC048350 TaxID=3365538 RepID=UPI003720F191
MTTVGPVALRAPVLHDEVSAARGARWIATEAVTVAVVNHVRALALTRLLDIGSYLRRVPLHLAGAVSIALLPMLSRRRAGAPLSARATGVVMVALPLTVVGATAPGVVLTTVFPGGYPQPSTLMAGTAAAGLVLGAMSLLASFSQTVNGRVVLRPLWIGLFGHVSGLTAGWVAGGVLGMAIGGMCGTVVALGVLLIREAGRHGSAEHAVAPHAAVLAALAPVLVLGSVLPALRPHPVLWLLAAILTTTLALGRFLTRRGALDPDPDENGQGEGVSQEAMPDGTEPYETRSDGTERRESRSDRVGPGPDTRQNSERALRLLVDAVWRGDPRPASDEELRAALAAARVNRVEGRLARAYPRQLATTLDAVSDAAHLFRRNLVESTDRLGAADIPTVLIKADLSGDLVHGDFDLVVPTDRWKAAQEALRGWFVKRSTRWLERSTSVLLAPPGGPSAQLHTSVAWHGVSVMATDRLFAHAVPDHDGRAWLVPCPADRLRIWLAHGLFRNQSLDLSELLALRELLAPEVVAEARAQTAREGWSAGADRALDLATGAMAALDRGDLVLLPLPLPVSTSLRTGMGHAGHLLSRGRASTAAREVALRVPLVVTERLRRRSS